MYYTKESDNSDTHSCMYEFGSDKTTTEIIQL
jgi:hypothetical protein